MEKKSPPLIFFFSFCLLLVNLVVIISFTIILKGCLPIVVWCSLSSICILVNVSQNVKSIALRMQFLGLCLIFMPLLNNFEMKNDIIVS